MFDKGVRHSQSKPQWVCGLVAALLLAQWLVFTHVHDQNSATADALCSVCLVGEHFHHAVGNSPIIVTRQPLLPAAFVVFTQAVLQPLYPAFRSRAPPILL